MHRSLATPDGSPIVNRVPSMCLITPGDTISVEQYTTQPMLCDAGTEAAITPPGSTLSRPGWYHQGMPFCAQITPASGASSGPSRGAISGRLYAFSPTSTTSAPATAPRSSVTGGRAVKSPRGDSTRTP